MDRIPIGLELYSVRHELKKDTRGTLKAVAEMGYDGVEFAGNPQHTAEELRPMLDEFGLLCCGWHTPLELVQDDKLEDTIAFNKTLGNSYIIVPGIPKNLSSSRNDWLKIAEMFNELAGKLAPHDMLIGYHNHHVEFTPLDGEVPWDTLGGNTRREVIMQLDTGNAMYGGAECVPLLERYPGRSVTVHLKPYKHVKEGEEPITGFATMIGEDDTPWADVFRLCETIGGTEWYIIEYESDALPSMEGVERCLKALKEMGK